MLIDKIKFLEPRQRSLDPRPYRWRAPGYWPGSHSPLLEITKQKAELESDVDEALATARSFVAEHSGSAKLE